MKMEHHKLAKLEEQYDALLDAIRDALTSGESGFMVRRLLEGLEVCGVLKEDDKAGKGE
jgi:hypothetical protein